MVWLGTVLLGFIISAASARGTLRRVEHISETVAGIGSDDLSRRLAEGRTNDEISRLSSTFNQMLDRIQTSVNQLRTLTDSVAHDMKSPVTAIRGRLEVALSTNNSAHSRELVAEAIDGLDHLSHFLNTTLDLAEAEAGALHLNREMIDVSAILRQQIDLYQPALAAHNHALTSDVEERVSIDGDVPLIHRLISNLFENELAHLPNGCNIRVELHALNRHAQLIIHDNGPGFAPELRDHVFERFVKGKQSHGWGLGLAFVNAVAQAHGGSATIGDSPEGGAAIRLMLPLNNPIGP
jgi:signal transduction histidine kinase